jgi:hypothetical protein
MAKRRRTSKSAKRRPRAASPRALGDAHRFGCARIKRRAVRIARPRGICLACRNHSGDLGAALEAWIDQAHAFERGQRGAISVEMVGLPLHRLFPLKAEPGQVLVDRRLVLGSAARSVDILDAQQQPAARSPRHVGIQQRRQRMAEMQVAVRRRGKAENGWHGLSWTVPNTPFIPAQAGIRRRVPAFAGTSGILLRTHQ